MTAPDSAENGTPCKRGDRQHHNASPSHAEGAWCNECGDFVPLSRFDGSQLNGLAPYLGVVGKSPAYAAEIEAAAEALWVALDRNDATDEMPWAAEAHRLWMALTAEDRAQTAKGPQFDRERP